MAKELTLKSVKPADIDIKGELMGSPFGNSEMETIARNVILISRWHLGWFSFSWEDYKRLCKHHVTDSEKDVLDELVNWGVLEFDGKKYNPTDKLIETLEEFVK